MKNTKKIPIFLASLTLVVAGLGGNLSAGAISGVSQNLIELARGATDEFSLEINDIDAYLKLDLIKYSLGEASGVVSVPDEGDWYIKKIVVAYMNFGQGISEAEADQNLTTLKGNGDSNWQVVSLYENHPSWPRETQNISLNQTNASRNVMTNKSDILYYAVEFGEIVDGEWAETWWSRGKINYRACVHSAVFDAEAMNCARTEDDGKVKYLPQRKNGGLLVELPENEQVVTWEDEWRDVISANYELVQNETEAMWGYLNGGLLTLNQNDLILDGILKSVAHYSAADSKLLWIPQGVGILKARIAEMKKFFEKTDDTSGLEILEKENEDLRQEKTVLEAEKERLERENRELEKEILRLRTESETLQGKMEDIERENGMVKSENQSLRQEIERMGEEMAKMQQDINSPEVIERVEVVEKMTDGQKCEIVKTSPEVMEAGSNDVKMTDSQNGEKIDDGITETVDNEEVGLPNLGGEEIKTGGVWWWLIPVVGFVGVIVLYMRRKFSKE